MSEEQLDESLEITDAGEGSSSSINVYEYLDFQKLMRDLWLSRKTGHAVFSHREMSEKIGAKSSAFFQNTVSGRKRLSRKMIPKVAKLFELDRKESEYFRLLVEFNQADTPQATRTALLDLNFFIRNKIKNAPRYVYEFYSKWYYSAIYSLLGFYDFSDNYRELASAVFPPIGVYQAKDSIQLLESLGLIAKDARGIYLPTDHFIPPDDYPSKVIAHEYQDEIIGLAFDALDSFPMDKRHASNVTIGMSEALYQTVVREVQELRRRVVEMASCDPHPERVYTINFQVAPLSRNIADFSTEPVVEEPAPPRNDDDDDEELDDNDE